MGLKGEIDEVKVAWSTSSWCFRGWLCFLAWWGSGGT